MPGAADGGLVFDDEGLTVGEYLERWPNDSVQGDVAHRTSHSYLYHVRHHISPALKRTKLKSRSPMQVQGLYHSKLDGGSAPSDLRYEPAGHELGRDAALVPETLCWIRETAKQDRAIREELDAAWASRYGANTGRPA